MATYNTAFGSLPGYNEMLGTTNTTGGGQQQVYGQRAQQQRQQQQQPAPAQTFAQMQQRGMARPAPPSAPQAQAFQQYGGSQQAQQMRQRLQQQLEQFGQAPSRYDTQAFQQIRGAQAANLQQEYRGQQQALNEELARRGLSASSVGGGRMGDLAGQQARALADLDARLLQQAAETQAQDRAQLLAAGQGLSELAGSQDLAQFEANRVAQAATFENQLRAAQFGQQQFEQAGQEAFQGAQAEEAAQQAARAFDLQATGQAAGLSMDLQRLLGQQELERGQLTGMLGGMQTLAGRQFGEQQRQFDIQQALQAQLGLGGLSLQQRQQAAQEAQFGMSLAEQQAGRLQQAGLSQQEINLRAQQLQQDAANQGRQLSLEEARLQVQQQQFGAQLGETQAARLQQYGVTQQELGLRSQQLQQEAQLQGRQLSIQEAQNQAGNQIERERMAQQGQQFGLQLGETQAARLQQYGLSVQELGLRSQQLQQEAALQGRQMSIAEAQNLAQNQLEQQRVTNQAAQFGLQLNEQQAQRLQQGGFTAQELALESQRVANQALQFGQQLSAQERQNQAINSLEARKLEEDANFRSQQLGLNRDELEVRKNQIKGDLTLRGIEIDDQRAYREAEIEARTQQIQNEFTRSGQQIDVDEARIQAQKDISDADNTAQMNRLKAQLSAQASESSLERQLRGALGMAETTGFVFDPATGRIVQQDGQNVMTVQGRSALAQQRLAENQFLMQVVSSLGNVDLSKSIKDFVADRGALDRGGGYDPRGGGGDDGKDGGDTGQTDSIKGRRSVASEFNPAFMDNLASVLDQPGSFSYAREAAAPSSTLQALASALGISPAALRSLQTGARSTTTQSALSNVLSGLQPSAPTTPASMTVQRAIQQSPSLQAMNARLAALPADQRSQYIPAERLPMQFLQGQAVPEEAQPGTVFSAYSAGPDGKTTYGNTFMGYDGTGFIPLRRQVESTPGGGTGYRYYTATGQNWA